MIIFKSPLSVFCLCHGMDFIVVHVFIEKEHLKFLLDMEIEPFRYNFTRYCISKLLEGSN